MTAVPASNVLRAEAASIALAEPGEGSVSLADLEPGVRGRVAAVDRSGPEGERLLDLGFVPGTAVAVIKRAPLRDPVVYELRGYRICLRRSEARRIRVIPE
jgi:ferrous iron transport protein A